MAQEHLEEVELDAGEGEACARRAAPLAVERSSVEVPDAEQAALALEAAPQQGAQPGQQLGQRVGLDQVVVGAGIEPLHAVVDGVARRQHQHRACRRRRCACAGTRSGRRGRAGRGRG